MKDWLRWLQVAGNLVVSAMLVGWTSQEPGIWRDISMYCAGTLGGYALMALLQPTISARWRAQMEAEIAIMTAAVFARIMKEATGIKPEMVILSKYQAPPTAPMH